MADLNDLIHKSITDMSVDEAIEHLRQLRLSRRIPEKKTRQKQTKQPTPVSADQAAEILKLLGGS